MNFPVEMKTRDVLAFLLHGLQFEFVGTAQDFHERLPHYFFAVLDNHSIRTFMLRRYS